MQDEAEFFLDLQLYPFVWRDAVEQAGRGFDEQVVVAIDISRVAKLPR